MQWFRMYSGVINDPKVQTLDGEIFKFWVNCLCLASQHNGVLPSIKEVAFVTRCNEKAVTYALQVLVEANLMTVTKNQHGETISPHNWKKRQYKSDSSAERVKRHRERRKTVTCNDTVTPPETETDTERKTVDDARANHATETHALGQKISKITGWDNDPNWMGNYSRIPSWLAAGWDPDLDILPTVTRVMAKRKSGTGPPNSLAYFEQAIADAHATRTAPTPKGEPSHGDPDQNFPDRRGAGNQQGAAGGLSKSERARRAALRGAGVDLAGISD